jgi:cytidyltransferase-like protein
MSGSAGGNRITRESVAKTTDNYINRILKKFPAFKSAKISGSYNTSAKEDFGDIDLIVNLKATDKKNIKLELAKFLSELPDDVIIPFKSEKYKGKKYLNTGEIVTILYPIEGQPDQYVQIDNIVSVSDDEAEFKKEFLDYPAEIQGLLLGLSKVICLEEDPKSIFARMGIKNIPKLEANQEYEFNLSSAGLTLRIVTLDNFKEVDRTEVWKTSNWSNIKKLFTNYKIDGNFEDLLNDIASKVKNPRSKNRIKGIFNSMVSIKSGEVGTPKGDNKQKSLDKVNNTLSETNLGRYLVSLLLEQDQPTIALFPGKFKPPHKGHFEVVKKLLQNADEVVILISPKTHDGVTADESAAVWELYKQKLDGNVEVRISAVTPVKDVYDFIENNPELTVYAAYGKGEEGRYKNLNKYPNAKIFDAGSTTEDGEDVSATNLRKAIRDNNDGEIRKYLPDGIEVNNFLKALGKETKEEPQPSNSLSTPVTERKYQNQDDTFADYILSKEADIEETAQMFNIPIPDVRYAFTVGNMVVLSDDIWDKLENKNHRDIDTTVGGPAMILNYDTDRYYLTYGSRILDDYKKLDKTPNVLMGVLDLEGPKPWPLKEGKLNENETAIISEFVKYAIKNLEIQKPPRNLTLSYDNEAAKEKRSFGYFDPNDNKIWVYCGNRNMADILRTLAHELVHRKQDEDGRISYESGKTGSEIENEANAKAGVLLRDFGKQHEEIYQ